MQDLGSFILKFKKLSSLTIRIIYSKLRSFEADILSKLILNIKHLSYIGLILTYNKIDEKGVEAIVESINTIAP